MEIIGCRCMAGALVGITDTLWAWPNPAAVGGVLMTGATTPLLEEMTTWCCCMGIKVGMKNG